MIEIGKTYCVEPTYKKSVEEHEIFGNEDKTKFVTLIQVWRWGTWFVTPQNADEVEMLEDGMKENGSCSISDFEQYEMDSTFDGQSTDFEFWPKAAWDDKEKEKFEEEYFETFFDVFDDYGLDSIDVEIYINCPITAVECEPPWVG